jgi:hypothetical protein
VDIVDEKRIGMPKEAGMRLKNSLALITDAIIAELIERIPLQHMAEPGEIAAFVAVTRLPTSPGK